MLAKNLVVPVSGAFAFMAMVAACAASLPKGDLSRYPAQAEETINICQGIPPLARAEFTWPTMRDRILRQPKVFKSVEHALCLIPSEYASNDVAMILNSFSLQSSSPRDPRVIVFSRDNRGLSDEMLFMSYNSAGFPGGSALEFLRYNPQAPIRNQIEMAEIEFAGKVSVHQGTPVRCQKCHGIEPQFLWGERDFWPAAAAGGSIYRTYQEFAELKKVLQSNPRLKNLNIGEFGSMQDRLSSINYRATMINSRRLYQKIMESPDYSYYKFAILGGALGCSNIEEFLPEPIRSRHRDISFVEEKFPSNVAQFLNSNFINGGQARLKNVDQVSVRHLADHLNGIAGAFLAKYGQSTWLSAFGLESGDITGHPSYTATTWPYYLADQMRIEKDKLLFGMKPDDYFALDPAFDLASVNLRYLFEARGIGIDNWSYNDVMGVYHIDLETMTLHPDGLTNVMIRSDRELSFAETSRLPGLEQEDRGQVFAREFSGAQEKNQRVCAALRLRSLKRLNGLAQPTIFDLRIHSSLEAKNWQHHFTNIKKVPNLPDDLPTNPKSTRSCTQCHFGYIANYTGPEFTRQSKSYPLALMICANCHSDTVNKVAPYIPFNNEVALRKFAAGEPGFSIGVGYRLSDEAKAQLHHMPPVFRLKKTDREAILKFVQSL